MKGRRDALGTMDDCATGRAAVPRPKSLRTRGAGHSSDFFSHGQRLGLILDGTDGQWQKLKLTDTTEPGEVTEVTEVAQELQQP